MHFTLNPLEQQLKGAIKLESRPPTFPIVPQTMAHLNRALNFNADHGGCGHWRMLWPESLINIREKGIINSSTAMIMDPRYYQGAKSVRLQRQATPLQLGFAQALRKLSNDSEKFKMIYEIDDIVFREDIPDYNACKHAFDDPTIAATCLKIMQLCDEITVPSDYMKEYYKDKTGSQNVKVIPNYVPRFWMDRFYSSTKIADKFEQNKKRLRVGYLGSGTHADMKNATNQQDDFSHILDAVIKTRKEFKWVFVGVLPLSLRPLLNSGDIEFHPWVSLDEYPYLYEKVGVNIAVASLQDNVFNRSKSNIKYLEAGCFGIPCVCQDMITYQMAPLKFKTGGDLIDQLKKLAGDRQYYMKQSKLARQYADTMWLEDHLDEYVKLYQL